MPEPSAIANVPMPSPPCEGLTWRDGAYLDEEGAAAEHAPTLGIDLDDLGGAPDPVCSIARLVAIKRDSVNLESFKRSISTLQDTATQTLIVRIATTTDALMLWALHLTLDKRNIPPCQRWPANTSTSQAEFITALADLLWFFKRDPRHVPRFRGWKALAALPPGHATWCEKAFWILTHIKGVHLARQAVKGLGLSDAQRQELMMFPTLKMFESRRELRGDVLVETEHRLYSQAMSQPDRSRLHLPAKVAGRRTQLWRCHILSGLSPTETAKNWEALTGEALSRQAISKQIDAIKTALRNWAI